MPDAIKDNRDKLRVARTRVSSPTWERFGARPTVARAGADACRFAPTGALFTKGKAVGEMRKDRTFLKYIVTAREKKQWIG